MTCTGRMFKRPAYAVCCLGIALTLGGRATAQELDPTTGLVKAENWELVLGHCSACHSLRLVSEQRLSRERWLEMIRWMQATQNLWQFEPETEERILDYLALNYAPQQLFSRRPPLETHLLPRP